MNGVSHKLTRRPASVAKLAITSVGFLVCCMTSFSQEVTWSSLSGRFLVDGPLPQVEPIDLGRDSCCIKANPADQRWLVGENQGIANVVISLRTSSRVEAPLPSKEVIPKEPMVLTNKGCSFSPRIVLLRTGQTLRITNEDPTTHNVAATLGRNASFNLVLPPKDFRDLPMKSAERKPLPVACNIHPYMRGYLSIRDDPYIAVSDSQGRFQIDPLPTGNWEFQLWHEGRYLPDARLVLNGQTKLTDARGRISLEIEPTKPLDLGDILIKPHN